MGGAKIPNILRHCTKIFPCVIKKTANLSYIRLTDTVGTYILYILKTFYYNSLQLHSEITLIIACKKMFYINITKNPVENCSPKKSTAI